MKEIDFITKLHTATKRNYLERMTEKKPEIIELSKKYDFDYWDGSRETGYRPAKCECKIGRIRGLSRAGNHT